MDKEHILCEHDLRNEEQQQCAGKGQPDDFPDG